MRQVILMMLKIDNHCALCYEWDGSGTPDCSSWSPEKLEYDEEKCCDIIISGICRNPKLLEERLKKCGG